MSVAAIVKLLVEVVLLFFRHRLDPERLKREVSERIERELQERRQDFRRALAERDEDGVSARLADVRDRLRGKPEGDVPPGE